jgi:beta-lactamase regulating signal transducer with metallopeptidase domain
MIHTVQAIAWTLIHFCWQAAAVAVLYRGVSLLTVSRSSNTRYVLALSALLLMLVCSAATGIYESSSPPFAGPVASPGVGAANSLYAPVRTPVTGGSPLQGASSAAVTAFSALGVSRVPVLSLPVLRLIDGLWLLGVLALSLRSLGGWWLIQRLSASANASAPAAARASFLRISSALGIRKPVLLRVTNAITGPVTVGALRALVLLPLSAATSLSPDELEVVLAHELAHVRRADFLWNLVQTMVETLFFFHPAVWWIGNRIRHERELCCDDLALEVCPDPVTYASALYRLELERSRNWRLAMALDGHQPAQTLRMRIARILGEPAAKAAQRGPFGLAAAGAVLAVLLLPVPQMLASLNPVRVASPPMAHLAIPESQSKPNPAHAATEGATSPSEAPAPAPSPDPQPVEVAANPEPQQEPAPSQEHKGDYIDRMKAAGYDVDLDKYIAMKVQDITPEYAAAMSQLGFGKLSADDLIACKVQDVTPEYIAKLKQQGIEVKDVHQAISYHIFEVTPEFVAGMKSAGYSGLSSEQLLSMRVQGVTPEYARSIAQQFPGATVEDLVKTRIFNIDAAFIASAKKHGFADLNLEKLVKLRISGILDDQDSK